MTTLDRLRLLHEIDRALLDSGSSEVVAQMAADGLLVGLGALRVMISIADEGVGVWRTVAIAGTPDAATVVGATHPLVLRGGVAGVEAAGFIVYQDVRDADQDLHDFAVRIGAGSGGILPLIAEGRTLGLMTIYFARRHGLSPARQTIVTEVSRQVAVALAQARDRTALYRRTDELERANRTLAIQHELDAAIVAERPFLDVVDLALERLSVELAFDRAGLSLIDDAAHTLEFVRSYGDPPPYPVGHRMAMRDLPGIERIIGSRIHHRDDILDTVHADTAKRTGLRTGIWATIEDRGRPVGILSIQRRAPGSLATESTLVRSVADQLGIAYTRDATRHLEARAEVLVRSSSDAVIAIDADNLIQAWSPRATEMFGWTEREALGVGLADLLVPDRFRAAHLAGVRRRAAAPVDAPMTNHFPELVARHREGHEMPIAVTVAHEPTTAGWRMVGFVRDRTAETEARDALMRELSRREAVAASLARLHAGTTVEATADAICAEMMTTLGLDVTAVDEFVGRGAKRRLVPLAVHGPAGVPIAVGHPLPADRTRYLTERSARGPWVDGFQAPDDATYLAQWRSAGIHSSVYVPVGPAGAPIALLVGGSALSHDADALTRLLPYMLEYAAITEALLASELTARLHAGEDRRRIDDVIRARRFYPVYQPIFRLDGAVLVGYEALTRFDDGRAPDLVFAQAEAVGLGEAMELATLDAAFAGAPDASSGLTLSVNVSPGLIASGRLDAILPTTRDRLILEVTEHVQILDYPAIRTAVDSLAPVRLAVDDAGAGYASLRHIIELSPDFVKLDIGLVRGIDQDPVRQGMVAGIAYFVSRSERSIIAEGIETAEELATLRSLGIGFGQGFLLGRPARLPRPVA